MCFSQYARFSEFLALFQDIHFSCLIFHVIQFSATFQVIECFCLILQVIQFPCHNPGTTVCILHFSRYSPFFAISLVLLWVFLIFHDFKFSCLTPGPTVCISHLPRFSLFRETHQVKQYLCLIFHVFFQFSAIIQVQECVFLLFYVFDCF